jgi:uncharacterized membrane protein YbhN (UPF0104 family)
VKVTWRKAIGVAVACVILLFIAKSLWSGLHGLGHYSFTASPWRIVGAFGAFAVLFPAYGWLWQYIMRKFGYPLPYGTTLKVWLLSQAGRYVPGKLWFALGRIYLCEREGIPAGVTTIATALELALVLGSAIVVFGLASLVRPSMGGQPYIWSIWLVPVIIICVHPRILRLGLSAVRRLRKRATRPAAGTGELGAFTMSYADVLKILGAYVLCWCVYGVGYYLIATAIGLKATGVSTPVPPNVTLLPEMIGINALSWAGGFVSLITPAGLGVREGISTFLLSGLLDKPYPSLIPLAARVWVTIAEVAAIGLAVVARGRK